MAILFDVLPDNVEIDGIKYEIATDYRIMAHFEHQLMTSDRGNRKTVAKIFFDTLLLFYKGNVPNDTDQAIEKLWWFYRCGEDISSKSNQAGTKSNVRLYDYEIDGAMIAAAFAETYQVDIINSHLHWWIFRSYFANLNEDTRFVKIMSYRGVEPKEFKGKQRRMYMKLKERYALPVIHHTPMTLEEREAEYKRRMIENRNQRIEEERKRKSGEKR